MPDISIPPPDLGAVGNVAQGAKSEGGGSGELKEFSVKRGDNGGVIVCETYKKTPPAGRRYGASFPEGGDYKENPFSPDDGAAAADYVTSLMGVMGVTASAPTPGPPDVAAIAGPRGAAIGGPRGGVARVGPPMGGGPPPDDSGY